MEDGGDAKSHEDFLILIPISQTVDVVYKTKLFVCYCLTPKSLEQAGVATAGFLFKH